MGRWRLVSGDSLMVCYVRRKIRLIESNAKSRFLKKLPMKGLWGVLTVWGPLPSYDPILPPPPPTHCVYSILYVPETHIMYFLCTRDPYYVLYRRCWFLKCSEEIHYVPIGAGDMWYYVPVDDGWEEVLGCNVYITSQYFSPNAKYWTNRTWAPPDRMWTLYHWAMESVHNITGARWPNSGLLDPKMAQ
jgi:hypothetical protein